MGWFEKLTGIKLFLVLPHRNYWIFYYMYSFRQPITPEVRSMWYGNMDPLDVKRIHLKVSKTFWGLFLPSRKHKFVIKYPVPDSPFEFVNFNINETLMFNDTLDSLTGSVVIIRDYCTNIEGAFYIEHFRRIHISYRNKTDAMTFKLML